MRSRLIIFAILLAAIGSGLAGSSTLHVAAREQSRDMLTRFAPTGGYDREEYGLNCFNRQTLNFDWVLELLTEESLVANVKREGDFFTDTDLPETEQVHPGDLTNSKHDRGHGACSRYHRRTLSENASTFSMRNMMAQASALNRGEWRALEETIAKFVQDGNLVWVLTATVWHAESGDKIVVRTIGPKRMWVPTHCMKAILVRHLDGSYEAKTWLIPNIDDVKPFDTYRVSAAYAQDVSHLDLWAALPDDIEKKIESTR